MVIHVLCRSGGVDCNSVMEDSTVPVWMVSCYCCAECCVVCGVFWHDFLKKQHWKIWHHSLTYLKTFHFFSKAPGQKMVCSYIYLDLRTISTMIFGDFWLLLCKTENPLWMMSGLMSGLMSEKSQIPLWNCPLSCVLRFFSCREWRFIRTQRRESERWQRIHQHEKHTTGLWHTAVEEGPQQVWGWFADWSCSAKSRLTLETFHDWVSNT